MYIWKIIMQQRNIYMLWLALFKIQIYFSKKVIGLKSKHLSSFQLLLNNTVILLNNNVYLLKLTSFVCTSRVPQCFITTNNFVKIIGTTLTSFASGGVETMQNMAVSKTYYLFKTGRLSLWERYEPWVHMCFYEKP